MVLEILDDIRDSGTVTLSTTIGLMLICIFKPSGIIFIKLSALEFGA